MTPVECWVVGGIGFVLFVVTSSVMSRLGRTMRANGGYGIVAFELAGSTAKAKAIFNAWGAEGRRAAKWSLVVDVPFIASYVAVPVVVACVSAAALRPGTVWPVVAAASGWAFVVAGALDLVEDALLAVVLADHEAPPAGLVPVASAAARVKFALALAATPVLLTAAVAALAP
jgi:hypothetical protein